MCLSMPTEELKLYPSVTGREICRDMRNGSDGQWSIGQEVEMMDDGIRFGCFCVSLFPSSHVWILALYKWCRHGL